MNAPEFLLTTRWSSTRPEDRFIVENPATREVLAHVAGGGAQQVDEAVAAARRGFEAWRRRPARERGRIL